MKKLTLLTTFLMMLTLALPTFAQDGEATPEPMMGGDMEGDMGNVEVTRMRFANLSPTVGVLDIYVEGEDIGLQQLAYPSVTGWVEIPADTFSVSFEYADVALDEEGVAETVLGPYTVTNEGEGWVTLAIAGSAQTDNLTVYKTVQNLGRLPEGCAHVTVFNAIPGSPTLEWRQTDTDVVFSGLGHIGGPQTDVTIANNPPTVYGMCPEPVDNPEAVISTLGPLECEPLSPVDGLGESSEDMGENPYCAFATFLPANVYDVRFADASVEGVEGAFQDIPNLELRPDFYFIALIGELGDSEYFVYELTQVVISELLETAAGEGTIGLENLLTPIPTGEAITPEPVG